MSASRWSRRAVLGGAVASAALGVARFGGPTRTLFVPTSVPLPFAQRLAGALEAALRAPVAVTQIRSVLTLPEAVARAGAQVYSFAGPSFDRALLGALEGRALTRLSFGVSLDDPRAAPTAPHVHLGLAHGFELAGRWAARTIGRRARLIATGHEATFDLGLAFRHGFELEGGEVVSTVVFDHQPAPSAPADVTVVLASGALAPRLWASLRGEPGVVLSHPFADAPAGTRLVRTWAEATAVEALASRVASASAAPSLAASVAGLTLPFHPLSAPATVADWANKSGNTTPYTGC